MFRELFESESATIYTSMGVSGTGLCRRLKEKEQSEIENALRSNSNSKKLKDWFVEANDEDEKYSDVLVIEYKGKKFTLYAANGQWRFGGNTSTGGQEGFYQCTDVVDFNINDLAKALEKAKIE
jgi:hypothetical protein